MRVYKKRDGKDEETKKHPKYTKQQGMESKK